VHCLGIVFDHLTAQLCCFRMVGHSEKGQDDRRARLAHSRVFLRVARDPPGTVTGEAEASVNAGATTQGLFP
jgi:hypothetical protein